MPGISWHRTHHYLLIGFRRLRLDGAELDEGSRTIPSPFSVEPFEFLVAPAFSTVSVTGGIRLVGPMGDNLVVRMAGDEGAM